MERRLIDKVMIVASGAVFAGSFLLSTEARAQTVDDSSDPSTPKDDSQTEGDVNQNTDSQIGYSGGVKVAQDTIVGYIQPVYDGKYTPIRSAGTSRIERIQSTTVPEDSPGRSIRNPIQSPIVEISNAQSNSQEPASAEIARLVMSPGDIFKRDDTIVPDNPVATLTPETSNMTTSSLLSKESAKLSSRGVVALTLGGQTVEMQLTPGVQISIDDDRIVISASSDSTMAPSSSNVADMNSAPMQNTTVQQVDEPQESVSLPQIDESIEQVSTQPSFGSYAEYMENYTPSPEPASVIEMRNAVSVRDSGGLLERSTEWQNKMDWLESETDKLVSTDAYELFKNGGLDVSVSELDLFSSELPGTKLSSITCYVLHWTGGINDDPTQLALMMLNRDITSNVQMFTTQDGIPFLITKSLDTKAYHAAGANECVGNEIVANDLLDITTQQVLTQIVMAVFLHREYGMSLERNVQASLLERDQYGDLVMPTEADAGSVLSHKEIDESSISGKVDATTMLANYVFQKAVELNNILDGIPTLDNTSQIINQMPSSIDPATNTVSVEVDSDNEFFDPSELIIVSDDNLLDAIVEESVKEDGFEVAASTILAPNEQVVSQNDGPQDGTLDLGAIHVDAEETENETQIDYSKFEPLLDPEFLDTTPEITPEEAFDFSAQSRQNGGQIGQNEAYGELLEVDDVYVGLRANELDEIESSVMTAVGLRETGLREHSVGDHGDSPELGLQPDVMASYGPFQVRDLNDGNPVRDPTENLIPIEAVENAADLYLQSGSSPWEVVMPSELSEESIFQAIRLPDRDLGDARQGFDERMRNIARDVFAMQQQYEPKVAEILGDNNDN